MSLPSPSDPTVLDRELYVERPPIAREGLEVAGRYALVRCRGRGGIGEVWEAQEARTQRRVAVKLLLPGWHANDGIRQRFMREGRLAGTMQHRHIVEVLDVGETREGAPYIAMELLEGQPLHTVVAEQGPMPWTKVRRIMLQLCGALDHAHSMKIVHRDVKPSNVMFASDDGTDNCKLVDFGIAKQNLAGKQMQHLTGEGQMLGSPGFMCPEQLQGRPTDFRSDIYGLGCTGYYLLTGQVPFAGDSVPEMIHNALYCEPRQLDGGYLDDELRGAIEALFHRAVHRDPSARFGSALDFVVAINQIAEGTAPRTFELRPAIALTDRAIDPDAETNPGAESDGAASDDEGTPLAARVRTASGSSPVADSCGGSAPDVDTADEGGTAAAAAEAPVVMPRTTASGTGPRGVISTRSYSPLLRERPGLDRISWSCPEGFVELTRLLPDTVVVQMHGLLGASAAWLFETQLGRLLERHGPMQLFMHMGSMLSYPARVRDATLQCLTEHRRHIESMHLLTGTGVVGIAVSIAAVTVTGRPHVYEDELRWLAALDQAVAGRGRR